MFSSSSASRARPPTAARVSAPSSAHMKKQLRSSGFVKLVNDSLKNDATDTKNSSIDPSAPHSVCQRRRRLRRDRINENRQAPRAVQHRAQLRAP